MNRSTCVLLVGYLLVACNPQARADFRAGAACVDVTPVQLPVLVNGGMVSRTADRVKTRLHARAVVLDDGHLRVGIVVVDTCMMPRDLLDEAKALAVQRTGIPMDRILISATHAHSAPSCMGALGTNADPTYVPYLREKIAEALDQAAANLEPAQVGWAVANAADYTASRRWVRRPDRVELDPFGNPTVRANMHAANHWEDVTGPSGPEDPQLAMISVQSADGRRIAVLANFSMHYFGDQALSADYFGLFCEGLQSAFASDGPDERPPVVGILSHGCSGDIWRRDYALPADERNDGIPIEQYTEGLLEIALDACESIDHRADVDLAMAEARLPLNYRVPNQQLLEWSQRIVDGMGDRLPKDRPEIYAREQIFLHQRQSTEVVVQALRIGEIAIATTPTETYALTGMKIKLQSPLEKTMVIELANGGDGYIPPPEQHRLGGYNTWPARSAGLEVSAEPKIVGAALSLLEQVAGRPTRAYQQSRGEASQAILDLEPVAYWRLDEFSGPRAIDHSAHTHDAIYEPGVVFFLEGPQPDRFCRDGEPNRCPHFAGGRLQARIPDLAQDYSVSLWFWNGMPIDARDTTGWMFSRGPEHGLAPVGDHLGIGGRQQAAGKLIFQFANHPGEHQLVAGRTKIERWTWNHAVVVRKGKRVQVFLNGDPQPEIDVPAAATASGRFAQWFFGGRCDNQANWEGRLDEIAVFDRALSEDELAGLRGGAAE